RRRHTRFSRDWSSDVCSSDLDNPARFREQPAEPTSSEMDAFWHINGRLCCRCPYFSQKSMKTTTHPDGFFHANRLHPRAFREARSEERRVGKEGRRRERREAR